MVSTKARCGARRCLRGTAVAAILLGSAGSMSAFGYSYWQNATLTRDAARDAAAFYDAARNELSRTVVEDSNPSVVMPYLQDLRSMTAGYGDPEAPGFWQGLGLSRHGELSGAARRAYSDGLERMLRPRLVLHMENTIPQLIADEDTAGGLPRAEGLSAAGRGRAGRWRGQ